VKNLVSYVRLFRETSPFVGSLSRVQTGIRSALRIFAKEYQLDEAATDSVSMAIKANMQKAVLTVATLTQRLKTLVDYNTFLAGKAEVPKNVLEALVVHHLLLADLSDDVPSKLTSEYCGQMIWRVADSLMSGSLQEMCAAAMAAE